MLRLSVAFFLIKGSDILELKFLIALNFFLHENSVYKHCNYYLWETVLLKNEALRHLYHIISFYSDAHHAACMNF